MDKQLVKVTEGSSSQSDCKEITVSFGKNGHGLTTEFQEISKIVEDLSKEGEVYLSKAFIDELDDVYDLVFHVFS